MFIIVYILKMLVLQSLQNEIEESLEEFNNRGQLTEAAVNIVIKCFNDKADHNVLLATQKYRDNHIFTQLFSSLVPIQLIMPNDESIRKKCKEYEKIRTIENADMLCNGNPGKNFIVYASSNLSLMFYLKILNKSTWWNHKGFFLLINTDVVSGCEMADAFFNTSWTFNILSAVFLCYSSLSSKLELYTFNPYSNLAPRFWKLIDGNNNRWFLFKQSMEMSYNFSHTALCENLNFDKTKKLDGHRIRMGAYVHSNLLLYDANETGLERFGGVNGDITRMISLNLNIMADVKFYKEMGMIDDRGFFQGFLKDLQVGKIDFAVNMNLLRRDWKAQTYPHETSGFCIVSLKDPVTFLQKFQLVFTPQVWLILGLTFLVTVLILKHRLKQTLPYATLEFLRMIQNTPSRAKSPQDSCNRIIFLSAVILTNIMNSFFQSQLNSINVAPDTNPTIDTFDDLVRSDLTMYGTLSYKELMSDLPVSDRYRLSEYTHCIKHLFRGERIVCIPGCIEARFSVQEGEKVHISSKELRQYFMVFSVRQDWPLLSRFNRVLKLMTEAGFINLFRIRESRFFQYNVETQDPAKGIKLRNVKFAFALLIFGLVTSMCALCGEIIVRIIKTRPLLFPNMLLQKVF